VAKALKVVRAYNTIYGAKITVEADRYASAVYGSFMGDREFYLNEGYQLTLRVKGRDWQRGDRLSMSGLISVAWDWSSIPWQWA
jgi:hypothetical protein